MILDLVTEPCWADWSADLLSVLERSDWVSIESNYEVLEQLRSLFGHSTSYVVADVDGVLIRFEDDSTQYLPRPPSQSAPKRDLSDDG